MLKLNNDYRVVYAVCFVVSFVLFSSVPRSFFRLNHVRKVWKRCSHSWFSFQATILGIFDRNVGLCCSCFSVANGRRSQAKTRGDKILIKSGFLSLCQNLNMIKLDC